ncbi:unnamed protein product [Phytomonas sp. EM1]|nr:unnamed protein product [Phytomonas sp. EM1]|eukprot:CCW63613.1 unnamed protein product [Phytomonas sp. isolate EM1]
MMTDNANQWRVVGRFRQRQLLESNSMVSLMDLTSSTPQDTPILLYDMKLEDGDEFKVPRYVATKINTPKPSQSMNVISLAPPKDLFSEGMTIPNFNSHIPSLPSPRINRYSKNDSQLLISTLIPFPSNFALLIPLLLFFADVTLFVVSLVAQNVPPVNIAKLCSIIIISGVVALILMINKGVYSTAFALHVFLWPNIFLMYYHLHTLSFFLFHAVFVIIVVGFILRLRRSLYNTCWVLQ